MHVSGYSFSNTINLYDGATLTAELPVSADYKITNDGSDDTYIVKYGGPVYTLGAPSAPSDVKLIYNNTYFPFTVKSGSLAEPGVDTIVGGSHGGVTLTAVGDKWGVVSGHKVISPL